MRGHFGAVVADFFAAEFRPDFAPGAAGEVEGAFGAAFVHWQDKAEAGDAAFVAQRLFQRHAEGEGAVFNGVVVVDVQVAVAVQVETEAAVGGDLVKHMVVVADAGRNVVQTGFVQPDFGADAGFFGVAADGGVARRAVFGQRGRQQFSAIAAQPRRSRW